MNTTQKIIHQILAFGQQRSVLLTDVESDNDHGYFYCGVVRDNGFFEIVHVISKPGVGDDHDPFSFYEIDLDNVIRGSFENHADWPGEVFDAESELPKYPPVSDEWDDDDVYYHLDHDELRFEVAGLLVMTDMGFYDMRTEPIVFQPKA